MKRLRLSLSTAFFWSAITACGIFYAQYDSIAYGGYYRTYLLHLPAGYDGASDLPLIIALHGGFGNAYRIERQSRLSAKADAEHFIVVYPEGVRGGLLSVRSWNAGGCCGFAANAGIDDVGFINALLDTLIHTYAVDTARIYATGMSNGGYMAYRLACESADRIAAIAPVAASMSLNNCRPERAVPVIDFHSYLDTHVPYNGGVGDGPSNHYNPPKDSVLNVWNNLNACLSIDTLIHNAQYTYVKWSHCNCNTEIHHYATQDGGHSWPGGEQTPAGAPVSRYIDATDLMWTFFQQHTLACHSLSVKPGKTKNNPVDVFPNPTGGKFSVRFNNETNKFVWSILNPEGKILFTGRSSRMDISHLPEGIYLLKIVTDDFTALKKLIKIPQNFN